MKAVKNSIVFLPLVIVGLIGGCDQPAVDWQPILERSTSHVLRVEVERVSEAVDEAMSTAGSNPEETVARLQVAERSLRHLLDFYLPLMEAREHAYNALLFFNLGKVDRTDEELDLCEDLLEAIARVDQGALLREMEPPLEELGDARAAIRADPLIAHDLLQNLTTRLNNMVLKGGLIVD